MKGVLWCVALVGLGVPLALLGLALESERLMALGAGAVATVMVGWPVLLLMGEVPARRGSCRRTGRGD